MRRLSIALLAAWIAGAGCESRTRLSPVAPGGHGSFDGDVVRDVGQHWSPYVGMHVDGQALDASRDALSMLRRTGRLSGVRIEITRSRQNPIDPIVKAIGALGVELLALVGNEYLFVSDIEGEIDRIFAAYPEIRYFQIGNEITTILPASGPTITIEQYMEAFRRIYEHVGRRHPGRVLLTQSTLGSGLHGPLELEAMAGLGLAGMDPNRVILAVNAYDPDNLSQYRGVLGGALRRFRVWVTESGVADLGLHVAFVQQKYPLLRRYLRAERVYWYVLWGGESGNDTEFSLIRQPARYPDYWKSPLLELLAGAR